jgi:DNA primase (bacterial type)
MEKALQRFEGNRLTALQYLEGRGISLEAARRHRLGVVFLSEQGAYEQYAGRLAIPYLDRLGVYGFKFRCLAHDDCKKNSCSKYLNPLDQEVGVYGVLALDDDTSETLHVTEGEMDAIALSQHTPEPVIGIPGADAWKAHWACHFSGFERVVAWCHGDPAGTKWGRRLRESCRNVETIGLPASEDVNSLILKWGADAVLKLANGGDDD